MRDQPVIRKAVATSRSTVDSPFERLLLWLGFEHDFIDEFIGDLDEECAERKRLHGPVPARLMCAVEVVRSLPALLATAVGRGDAVTRVRVATAGAIVVSAVASALIFMLTKPGAPAMIIPSNGDPIEGIVVNNLRAVPIQASVLDSHGRRVESKTVRYSWKSGSPLAISSSGVITCAQRADAVVRASIGAVNADLNVRCRPVREVRASSWLDFVVGDEPRDLPFVAVGMDGEAVMQLRGMAEVSDTSIAAVQGSRVVPRAAGRTDLTLRIGDRGTKMEILVHERVSSFTGLRADQKFVAMPVRLAHGDTISRTLPRGAYWFRYIPRVADAAPPSIEMHGDMYCEPGEALRARRVPEDQVAIYCIVPHGGSVTISHGMAGAEVVEGLVTLDQIDERRDATPTRSAGRVAP